MRQISLIKQRENKNNFCFFKIIIFCIIGIVIFLSLQSLLIPRWNYPKFLNNASYMFDTFYAQEEDCNEVIFLGSSHALYGISPMELYKEDGIVSYTLGTSYQPLAGSYFILKQALEKQSPSVVVLDVSKAFNVDEVSDEDWRYILDELPMGKNKIQAAIYYAKLGVTDEKDISAMQERFNSVMFPMIQYHTRWNQLEESDFRDYFNENDYYTAGYCLSTVVANSGITVERMNDWAYRNNSDRDAWKIEYKNDVKKEEHIENVLYEPSLSEEAIYWLREINELCMDNEIELQLIKVPAIKSPIYYAGSWTELKSNVVKEFAEKEGIAFLDLLYDVDTGIEETTEFMDGGGHLNYQGAKKISLFLSDYLTENYEVGGKVNTLFEENVSLYDSIIKVANLQTETNFVEYMEYLQPWLENYIICIAACDDMWYGLTDDDKAALCELGLQTDFENDLHEYDAFVSVINSAKIEYEATSNRRLQYETIIDGISINIVSSGYATGSEAQIVIDGTDYATDTVGINIVVIDRETKMVVDSVTFNTSVAPHNYNHKNASNNLNNYWLVKKEMSK